MKRILLMLTMVLLLAGCSLVPGQYRSTKPHVSPEQAQLPMAVEVSDFESMKSAMLTYVRAGREKCSIRAMDYTGDVEADVVQAVYEVMRQTPEGAFAVDVMNHSCARIVNYYEIRLDITYRRTAAEIAGIRQTEDPEDIKAHMEQALSRFDARLAMMIPEKQEYDMQAIMEEYFLQNPSALAEIPKLTVSVYPDSGAQRVVEVEFAYENTLQELLQMRDAVAESVDAAAEYIRYRQSDRDKVLLLYTYLTERFDYVEGTTATPIYSALCEGVADPTGLAYGFALICQRAGVTCHTVSGLLDGEKYTWNIVSDDGDYRHVDLSRCILQSSGMWLQTDWEMGRYYWNTQEYPACVPEEAPVEEEPPSEDAPSDPDAPETEEEGTQPPAEIPENSEEEIL